MEDERSVVTSDERLADRMWYKCGHARHTTCLFANSELSLVDPCSGPIEIHHVFGKGSDRIRWELAFAVGLCAHHHRGSTKCSPHGASRGFWTEWERMQPTVVDRLRNLRLFNMRGEPHKATDAIAMMTDILKKR